jgi:hypothetical protein
MRRLKRNSTSEERVSVDPGLNGCGLAFWSEADWLRLAAPVKVLNIYARKGTWAERADILGDRFKTELVARRVVAVYIEFPEFMPDTARGWTSTAKGDVYKLSFLIGVLFRVCSELSIPEVTLVRVRDWKGQLPKEVVERRIKRRVPAVMRFKPMSHSWDAIGIGLWAKGVLNETR